ncbi:MAG TPA: hypothetical protein VF207_04440 [Chthoniobacterales bacterium]
MDIAPVDVVAGMPNNLFAHVRWLFARSPGGKWEKAIQELNDAPHVKQGIRLSSKL